MGIKKMVETTLRKMLMGRVAFARWWCRENDIGTFYVNTDGTVDVGGDLNLFNNKLTEIPVKFNVVEGSVHIKYNKLTRLKGWFPERVGGVIDLSENSLLDLDGLPDRLLNKLYLDNALDIKNGLLYGLPTKIQNRSNIELKQYEPFYEVYNRYFNQLKNIPSDVLDVMDRDEVYAYVVMKDRYVKERLIGERKVHISRERVENIESMTNFL